MRPTWFEDDRAPRRRAFNLRAPRTVTGVLLLANVTVFLLQNILALFQRDALMPRLDPLTAALGLDTGAILDGAVFLCLYQLVTYQFLHAGVWHLLMNMIVLWFFGRTLEAFLGSRRFLFLYLAGGVMGGIAFLIWSAAAGLADPVVGASGAIYGIVVYYAFLWPRQRVNLFLFPLMVPIQVMHLAMVFVGISLFLGVFAPGSGTAHFSHLGGALFGFLFYRYEGRWRRAAESAREWKASREEESDLRRQAKIDRLLQKIHDEGLSSLTPQERTFLNEASRKIRKKR